MKKEVYFQTKDVEATEAFVRKVAYVLSALDDALYKEGISIFLDEADNGQKSVWMGDQTCKMKLDQALMENDML